jgi:hypothetical protein
MCLLYDRAAGGATDFRDWHWRRRAFAQDPSPDVSHLAPLQSHSLFLANICRLGVQNIRANGQTAKKYE